MTIIIILEYTGYVFISQYASLVSQKILHHVKLPK